MALIVHKAFVLTRADGEHKVYAVGDTVEDGDSAHWYSLAHAKEPVNQVEAVVEAVVESAPVVPVVEEITVEAPTETPVDAVVETVVDATVETPAEETKASKKGK